MKLLCGNYHTSFQLILLCYFFPKSTKRWLPCILLLKTHEFNMYLRVYKRSYLTKKIHLTMSSLRHLHVNSWRFLHVFRRTFRSVEHVAKKSASRQHLVNSNSNCSFPQVHRLGIAVVQKVLPEHLRSSSKFQHKTRFELWKGSC